PFASILAKCSPGLPKFCGRRALAEGELSPSAVVHVWMFLRNICLLQRGDVLQILLSGRGSFRGDQVRLADDKELLALELHGDAVSPALLKYQSGCGSLNINAHTIVKNSDLIGEQSRRISQCRCSKPR